MKEMNITHDDELSNVELPDNVIPTGIFSLLKDSIEMRKPRGNSDVYKPREVKDLGIKQKRVEILNALAQVINHYSLENLSNTPDHILAKVAYEAIINFSDQVVLRTEWYNKD